jgi:7-carboxy-7-deazaguanine synthase
MDSSQLLVNEIFYSIQGESLFAGLPCIFVRLTGCNLRCTYCDTTYAWDQGEPMGIEEVISKIETFPGSLVEVTGGEPLLQAATNALTAQLFALGYEVLMETNGSLPIDAIDTRCVKIMDLKCPSSGQSEYNDMQNISRLMPHDQVKFVIADRGDFEFAKQIIHRKNFPIAPANILFSPAAGRLDPKQLAEWILQAGLTVRLQLQLHKVIWPGEPRGV